MAEGGGSGGGGGGDWLRLSSFDAASFFAQQQRQQEENRAVQGQQLQAAADLLLPSSSDDDSSGSRGRDRSRGRSRSSSRGRSKPGKKRRRKEKESSRERGRRKEKEGKEKRRRQQREAEREQQVRAERATGAAQRAPQVKAWAPAKAGAAPAEPYYFDTRGDPANLAFGALYRMDVAAYRRHDPAGFAAALGARRRGPAAYGVRQLATEADGHVQRDRATRYFAPGSQRAERSVRLRRWRRILQQQQDDAGAGSADASAAVLLGWGRGGGAAAQRAPRAAQPRMALPSPSFLPLRLEDEGGAASAAGPRGSAAQQGRPPVLSAAEEMAEEAAERRRREGETNEELLLRRTREFNAAVRQSPHDIQLWLRFARFQDEALRLGPPRRGGERGAAEKKIAVLEKALSLHPGSDELLLALLQAAEAVCEEGEMERRWRGVLARHPGSPRLWRAYLHHRRTLFGRFSAPEVAAAHDEAFAGLRREHTRRAAQGAPPDVLSSLECEAAAVALEGLALRLAAGAGERALAGLLVLLEYNFFSPEGWPSDALEAMFEEFWRSGAPLVGTPGATAGWGAWLAGEPAAAAAAQAAGAGARRRREERDAEAQAQQAQQQTQQQEQSGWEELAPAIRARFGHGLRFDGEGNEAAAAEGPAEPSEEEEEAEAEEEQQEETDEQLLARLGMSLEAALGEAAEAQLTPPLLEAWLGTERARQAAQWQPQRAEAAAGGTEGDEEELERRTVGWDDVRRLLWRFKSEAARQHLLAGCLLLLGAPLPSALPSNSPAAAAAAAAGDELWLGAAATGCQPGSSAGGCRWAAELLAQGDWGWLVGAGGVPAPPRSLQQQPWYRGDATRLAALEQLLKALMRGPCRQDGGLAAALLAVAAEQEAAGGAAAAGRKPYEHARGLARQLLAEQRTNLVLWQAYTQLELAAGSTKAARRVYQTCFATASAPAGLAAAAAVAPLVLGAAQLELQAGGGGGGAGLPGPADAAPGCILPSQLAAATEAAVAAAARQLAWLGSGGAVPLPGGGASAAAAAEAALTQEEVVAAKRGFQNHLIALMQQQQQQQRGASAARGLSSGACALVAAAAAFELAAGQLRGDLSAGAKAAMALYDQALSALASPAQQVQQAQQARPADVHLEDLSWQRCAVAADAARHTLRCAPPAGVREALLRALRLFPGSAALMQLLLANEAAGHTFTQLRRELHGVLELHPSPQALLALVAVEVSSRSPGAVVAAALERAVTHPAGRHTPLLWRCYLRFEGYRGRHEAVRRVFLRAIGACPWSKGLWCDGLALLNGHVPPKELSEYLEVMKDKGITLRTDVFEVALAALEGGAGGGGSAEPAA